MFVVSVSTGTGTKKNLNYVSSFKVQVLEQRRIWIESIKIQVLEQRRIWIIWVHL